MTYFELHTVLKTFNDMLLFVFKWPVNCLTQIFRHCLLVKTFFLIFTSNKMFLSDKIIFGKLTISTKAFKPGEIISSLQCC